MQGSPQHSVWRERLGRAGFVSRGVIYILVGGIAVAVALGEEKGTSGQTGALASIADSGLGKVALALIALGLASYALYRLSEVIWGPVGEDDDAKAGVERIASIARVIIYAGLFVTSVRLIAGESGSSGGTKEGTSTAFDLPAGEALVLIAGLVMVGVGIYQGYKGLSQSFMDDLDGSRMNEAHEHTAKLAGSAGHLARGVVYSLIGVFLIKAAIENSAKQSKGLDGALQELAQQPFGAVLLGVVALGLLIMGIYSLIEARYRRV